MYVLKKQNCDKADVFNRDELAVQVESQMTGETSRHYYNFSLAVCVCACVCVSLSYKMHEKKLH